MEFHSHCSKRHCIELIYFKLLDEDCFLDLEFGEAMPHLKRLGDTGLTNDQVLHAIKCWMVAAIDERQVFGPKVSITLFLVPWTLETAWVLYTWSWHLPVFDVCAFWGFCESCKTDFEVTLYSQIRGKFSRKTYIFKKKYRYVLLGRKWIQNYVWENVG